jgi:hypothetical protein
MTFLIAVDKAIITDPDGARDNILVFINKLESFFETFVILIFFGVWIY